MPEYYYAECTQCGWHVSSEFVDQDPPDETGCSGNTSCPECHSRSIEEAYGGGMCMDLHTRIAELEAELAQMREPAKGGE